MIWRYSCCENVIMPMKDRTEKLLESRKVEN